jgi:hypothetical protein
MRNESGANFMFTTSYFPPGNYAPDQSVVDWEVDYSIGRATDVVLTASIADDLGQAILSPPLGKTATTVAFRMNQRVAMTLHGKLTELGRTMGWLPSTED